MATREAWRFFIRTIADHHKAFDDPGFFDEFLDWFMGEIEKAKVSKK